MLTVTVATAPPHRDTKFYVDELGVYALLRMPVRATPAHDRHLR
jgi:hypothetical protein